MCELNIGGGNMTVELRDNDTLYAKANTGNKQWVAVLTDTHPKYNYEREFVAYQKPKTSKRDSGTASVEDGAVIERVRYTHSGKNRKDQFFQLVDGEAHQIDEADVEAALEGEIVADVPGDDDDGETHECEECGDEFDSEHGLAVHEGIVHSEDEESEGENAVETDEGADLPVVADGGLEVREFSDVRHSDELVREYRTPPGGRLYAYRSDDDHHIVVSRGSEPGTRWERRVPATVERPIPGQQLWTIPDNWEQRVYSKREDHAKALYYVPESDVWVRVSIPTNDWLVDAWYGVQAVGDLDVEPVGELGTSYEVRQIADDLEAEGHEEDAAALRTISANWGAVETDLEHSTEWVRDEGLDEMQPGDQPVPVDRDWQVEFHQDRIFQPGEAISHAVDLPDDVELHILLDDLNNAGLFPSYYSFRLVIDTSAVGAEYYIQGLEEAGCSPAEALDYYFVEIAGMTQTDRADARGVDQSTVSGNVSEAKREIGK